MRSLLFSLFLISYAQANSQKYYLLAGSYTGSGSKGIYVYSFDANTGSIDSVTSTDGVINPSYLTISHNRRFVYACTETRTANAGSISAFTFDKKKGTIQFINKHSSGGDNPVYVSASKNGKWVFCGNYTGGSLAAFPANQDGSLLPASQVLKHPIEKTEQNKLKSSHVHSVVFSPDQKFLYVPDLGLDKIYTYQFTPKTLRPLMPAQHLSVDTDSGHGPRHFTFHPNKKFGYVTEELGGSVGVYRYNKGRLELIQNTLSHPANATGPFSSADIHVSPDGNFLYVSNRAKENNIAIFSIDKSTGKLTTVGYEATQGEVPRNFVIDPSGKYLLVANQQSGNVVVFKRNSKTGLLQPTGKQIKIPEVSCLKMVKR